MISKENHGPPRAPVRTPHVDRNLKGSVPWTVGCDLGAPSDMTKSEVNRVWEMIINTFVHNTDICRFEIVSMVEYKRFDGIYFLVV